MKSSMIFEGDVVRPSDLKGYRCGTLLSNLLFFGTRVLYSNVSIKTLFGCVLCSCGSAEVLSDRCITLGGADGFDATLGSDLSLSSSDVDGGESVVMRPNCSDKSTSALRIGSPACSDGYTVDGGSFKIVTISPAACLKKSSSFVSGTGITCGINSTVSHTLSLRCLGKYPLMHR